LVKSAGLTPVLDATRRPYEVQVSLLIPTHALPPLSYRVPQHLRQEVRPGTVVVAPLYGRPRLGVVVGTEGGQSARVLEDVRSVAGDLSLPPDLVEVCRRVCENAAVPLPAVLRAALPPGLETGRYRVLKPIPGGHWQTNDVVTRTALKRALGPEALRAAEADGRVELVPASPRRPTVEWATIRAAADPDLGRAPRQRELFDLLKERGGTSTTASLLAETDANRAALRDLVRRGAVRLVRRPEAPPTEAADGHQAADRDLEPFSRAAGRAMDSGGAFLWRTPTREQPDAVAAVIRTTLDGGEQALVLAPEIDVVGHLVNRLRRALPTGYTIVPYHSGLGRGRAAVYDAVRGGDVDVVVGTRTAALLPLARPGSICVVDEPSEGHRSEPGYEGLPVHARDLALERGRAEGMVVFYFSPFLSLRISAPEVRKRDRIRELPTRQSDAWPGVRIVDVRGSGATFSSTLLEACRLHLDEGKRVGVVANRLGYATVVSCTRCGAVKRCPNCDLPLALMGRTEPLVCTRCGHREANTRRCNECGSDRVVPTGMAAEKLRETLSESLGEPVGLITAARRELADSPAVVGTAHCVLEGEWDAVILPNVDAFLLASAIGAVERAYRLFHRAAEAARELLLVQTRIPEHYALRAGVRGDYEAFAAVELPRLRALGYPPFAHLSSLTFEGSEAAVRRAVESRLRPALEAGVEMSAVVPLGRSGNVPVWRVLLRSSERPAVARTATQAARLAAGIHGLKARVDVDPEEV
jgi:primosomal protein N' (replication factor Y)